MNSRPVLAGVLGALVIAFSGILVRLADVSPSTAAVFRCAVGPAAAGAARLHRAPALRHALERATACSPSVPGVIFAVDLTVWHHSIEAVGAGLATVLGGIQVVLVPLHRLARAGRAAGEPRAGLDPGGVHRRGADQRRDRRRRLRRGPAAGGDPTACSPRSPTRSSSSSCARATRTSAAPPGRCSTPRSPAASSPPSAAWWPAISTGRPGSSQRHGWSPCALTSQVLGWLLISVSLPRLPAVITSIVLMLQPVSTVFLGVVLLDEAPSAVQLSGVAVVLAGVAFATVRPLGIGQGRRGLRLGRCFRRSPTP